MIFNLSDLTYSTLGCWFKWWDGEYKFFLCEKKELTQNPCWQNRQIWLHHTSVTISGRKTHAWWWVRALYLTFAVSTYVAGCTVATSATNPRLRGVGLENESAEGNVCLKNPWKSADHRWTGEVFLMNIIFIWAHCWYLFFLFFKYV